MEIRIINNSIYSLKTKILPQASWYPKALRPRRTNSIQITFKSAEKTIPSSLNISVIHFFPPGASQFPQQALLLASLLLACFSEGRHQGPCMPRLASTGRSGTAGDTGGMVSPHSWLRAPPRILFSCITCKPCHCGLSACSDHSLR